MYVTSEVKQRVINKLNECIALVKAKYNVDVPFPHVVYLKRGTTAGTANHRTWTIDLNPVLLMENLDSFIEDTVPHELAHLACDLIYPEAHRPAQSMFAAYGRRQKREPHGPRWQEIMRALGADPSRCHNYDTTNSKVKKSTGRNVMWKCGCGETIMLTEKKSQLLRLAPGSMWHKGHRHLGLTEVKVATAPAAVQRTPVVIPERFVSRPAAPVAPVALNTTGRSKLDVCRTLFAQNRMASRSALIAMFVSAAQCTPAGAATYYATLKKQFA